MTTRTRPFHDIFGPMPKEFRDARVRMYLHACWNRFWDQLPLSLALAGVLYGVIDSLYLAGNLSRYIRLIIPIASVFLVPVIAVWRLDDDRRRAVLHREIPRIPVEQVFFYFLFYVRRLLRDLAQLDALLLAATDRRNTQFPDDAVKGSVRQIEASLHYLSFLAETLWQRLSSPSSSFLLKDHTRVDDARLRKKMNDYRGAVLDLFHARARLQVDSDAQNEIVAAEAAIDDSRRAIEEEVSAIARVTEPTIAREALRTTTEMGTSSMMQVLTRALIEILSDKSFDAAERLKRVDDLLDAVDAARSGGWLIRALMDLGRVVTGDGHLLAATLARHSGGRRRAAERVAHNVARIVDDARGGARRVCVATLGYSATLCECLEFARERVGPVFVLRCNNDADAADAAMLKDLAAKGVEAMIVDVGEGSLDRRLDDVRIVLFGFEAVSPTGELAHRHGLLPAAVPPIEAFVENQKQETPAPDRRTTPLVCAVGESWKVRSFEDVRDGRRTVPSRLIYRTRTPFWIVTDCAGPSGQGYHERQGDSFDLTCCQDAWGTERNSRDGRHAP
jgi:translation initiation factor 2B subunit (eIF-2B alpha/beta/delta family)